MRFFSLYLHIFNFFSSFDCFSAFFVSFLSFCSFEFWFKIIIFIRFGDCVFVFIGAKKTQKCTDSTDLSWLLKFKKKELELNINNFSEMKQNKWIEVQLPLLRLTASLSMRKNYKPKVEKIWNFVFILTLLIFYSFTREIKVCI